MVAGVGWKTSDGVCDTPVDVADRLGGHVVGQLVVGGLDGRESLLEERANGAVLSLIDLQMLHSLTTSENMEHISRQHVVLD